MRYAKTFFAALTLTLIAAAAMPKPAENLSEASIEYPDGTTVTIEYPDGTVVR